MKRRDLIKQLERIARSKGLPLTEGGNHTKATIGQWSEPIPRHREIHDLFARAILRRARS
ncbi:hypothetical protein EBQ10_06185 [Trueperella pyogenes]|uniref:Toxin HicA n=1 Tax=Trueperella pyogenes TaxID=1661 RepID=A0A3Q9GHU7_9ACTO|nr:hypothetical protein EBQ10_06185 [Trueperella pyogenes]